MQGLLFFFSFAAAVVDESGRYQKGVDITALAPPEISEADRNASIDLSKQPPEKLFRLLAFELLKEEKRPAERRLGIQEFQSLTELGCKEKLLLLTKDTLDLSDEMRIFHVNMTGNAGLYWLLHDYPQEHSWVWLITVSQERVMRKVSNHFTRAVASALDDPSGCLTPNFRTSLMNSVASWKKIHGDYVALLWNAVAFGVLGDVTSWREVDDETNMAEDGPGGPPPNVSWSENLIFGNMWVSSVQKWLEIHAQELGSSAWEEISDIDNGVAKQKAAAFVRWHRSRDGVLSSFEYLRRHMYGGWPLDKGLLRGLLRHVWRPGYGDSARVSVGDFGAGGGRYSEWLNDTGLVESFAFDAVLSVSDISGGRVLEVDLSKPIKLWRSFDWILCLGMSATSVSSFQTLLQNIRDHARHGVIFSSNDGSGEEDLVASIERETSFRLDRKATMVVREGCELNELAKTVNIFRASR
jgi:hypothetical protein